MKLMLERWVSAGGAKGSQQTIRHAFTPEADQSVFFLENPILELMTNIWVMSDAFTYTNIIKCKLPRIGELRLRNRERVLDSPRSRWQGGNKLSSRLRYYKALCVTTVSNSTEG